MRGLGDQRPAGKSEDRILRTRSASVDDAGRPVLAKAIGQRRVDQFDRLTRSLVSREPIPAAMISQKRPANARGPVAFIGIADFINDIPSRVFKTEFLSAIRESSCPIAGDQITVDRRV